MLHFCLAWLAVKNDEFSYLDDRPSIVPSGATMGRTRPQNQGDDLGADGIVKGIGWQSGQRAVLMEPKMKRLPSGFYLVTSLTKRIFGSVFNAWSPGGMIQTRMSPPRQPLRR